MSLISLSNTIFIFVLGYVYLFSTFGYGYILRKSFLKYSNAPVSSNFFLGFIVLILIQYFIYIFFKINAFTNSIILFFGFAISLKYFLKKKIFFNYSIIYLLLFTCLIVIKPHDDFHHHFSSVLTYLNKDFTFGLHNLDPVFGYQPPTVFLQTLTIIPPLYENFFYIFNYIIYLTFLIFLYEIYDDNKFDDIYKYISIVIFFFFLIKLNRLSEHGNDLPGQIFLLNFFIMFYIVDKDHNNFDNLIIGSLFFILSIAIKTPNIILMPMYLFVLYKYFKNQKLSKKIFFKYLNICMFFSLVVLFNNFQKSGCFVPLATFSCLELNWGVNLNEIKKFIIYSELDTKGFYNFDLHNFKDPNLYLKFYNWFPIWIKTHFFYKVFEFFLTFFIIFIICSFFVKFKKTKQVFKPKYEIFFILFSILSIVIWLNVFPQVRYFYGGLLIFLTLICFYFIKNELSLDKKKIKISILIVIILTNIFNLNRILKEHKKYENYLINIPLIHYPIEKISMINEYQMLCRTDYKCEYKKDLILKKNRFYNILYLN